MFLTRGVIGSILRAAAVLPCVTRSEPWRPFTHVSASHLSLKHSSGRIPVSARTAAIEPSGSGATVRYNASSLGVTTRSRCRSPRNSLIFGAEGIVPHSTAIRRTRRSTRSELLTLETCKPLPCRYAAKPVASSLVISSSLHSARDKKPTSARRFVLYQPSQVLGELCSKLALAQGSKRCSMNSFRAWGVESRKRGTDQSETGLRRVLRRNQGKKCHVLRGKIAGSVGRGAGHFAYDDLE
jgi:hypothetical protein